MTRVRALLTLLRDLGGFVTPARWALRRIPRYTWGLGILLLLGIILAIVYWDWLRGGDSTETASTTIRNVGLLGAGVVALWVAIWRGRIAERTLLNDRYQQAAAMLGNDLLSVRLAGIYALRELAKQHRDEYHVQVMHLLCAFIRDRGRESIGLASPPQHKDEIQQAIDAISECRQYDLSSVLERDGGYIFLDLQNTALQHSFLHESSLFHVNFSGANCRYAMLGRANLRHCFFSDADLQDAYLAYADLSSAYLTTAQVSGANFTGTNLSSTIFCVADDPVRGLTQEQLDAAIADPSHPPKLNGALDAKSGKPLVWRGKPAKPRRA